VGFAASLCVCVWSPRPSVEGTRTRPSVEGRLNHASSNSYLRTHAAGDSDPSLGLPQQQQHHHHRHWEFQLGVPPCWGSSSSMAPASPRRREMPAPRPTAITATLGASWFVRLADDASVGGWWWSTHEQRGCPRRSPWRAHKVEAMRNLYYEVIDVWYVVPARHHTANETICISLLSLSVDSLLLCYDDGAAVRSSKHAAEALLLIVPIRSPYPKSLFPLSRCALSRLALSAVSSTLMQLKSKLVVTPNAVDTLHCCSSRMSLGSPARLRGERRELCRERSLLPPATCSLSRGERC